MKTNLLKILVIVMFIFTLNISISAADNQYVSVDISSGGLFLTPKVSHAKMELTLSTPKGVVYSRTFTGGGSGFVSISELCKGNVPEGSYTFEVRLYPQERRESRADLEKATKKNANEMLIDRELIEPMLAHGHFTITGGSVKGGTGSVLGDEGTNDQDGGDQAADQIILDDLIVDGSACIGMDCVNGESFGFDTLRLKENNLRIRFVDTSSTSSFPSRDWQITVNDSANGGMNKFSIDDIDGGRTPFTIEAGAPSHSLYVDDGGRLGLGTSTPVVDVHVKTGNTPTLRLEQDGSSGFTPQTWDVAGNEANFFVRDATNGSTLPFRIFPGAPSNALNIEASTGDIGIGTTSPESKLHVFSSSTNPKILIEKDGGAKGQFLSKDDFVTFGSASNHPLRINANNTPYLYLLTNGNFGIGASSPSHPLEMGSGAHVTSGGAWTNGSSRDFKENIIDLTESEALETIRDLTPVKFTYKKEKNEEYIGFIAEDVPDLVAQKDRKSLSTMDVVAVLTKVVQQQQKAIEKLKEKLEKLEKNKK